MAQYNKQTEEYVDRNNNLFDVVLVSDEAGIINDENPLPVKQSGDWIIQTQQSLQGKLWTTQVAQGTVPGHSFQQITGYNPTTSSGDGVWAGGSAYPWSSFITAQTLYVKSSTNNATDRGSLITIVGLDSNYEMLSETVTMNATNSTTAVATTNQFLRLFYMFVDDGVDTNVGDIIATVTSGSGTIVNKMVAGRGIAYTGTYTIPAGKTGYLYKGDASSTAATVVDFYIRQYGKVFLVVHTAIVDNSTYVYDFPFPPTMPEKTDLYCKVNVGSGKTAINFEIMLVDNL